MKEYIKCPICGKEYLMLMTHITKIHKLSRNEFIQLYPNIKLLSDSVVRIGSTGRPCSAETKLKISLKKKGKKLNLSDEARQKLSNRFKGKPSWNKGLKTPPDIALKGAIARTGLKRSDETKAKMSKSMMGNTNLPKGPKSEEFKRKLSEYRTGRPHSDETKAKLREYAKNRTTEHQRKLRVASIERLEAKILNGHQLAPWYNKSGCQFFNQLMSETNTFIQHAENEKEFHIKELGYWVDGYDKENNIVYEYDEDHHFNIDGSLCEKDIIRQSEITGLLKCKFIRIKHNETEKYKNDIIAYIRTVIDEIRETNNRVSV